MDQNEVFSASAGFHLANAGVDRSVVLAEQVGALQKAHIQISNEPEISRLEHVLATLDGECRELRAAIASVVRAGVRDIPWPTWQTAMAVVFIAASFALTLMSLEPFGLESAFTWVGSVGIACLCGFATAEFLEKHDMKAIEQGLSIVLFVAGVAGLAVLASVRGDIFVHQIQTLTSSGDGTTSPDSGLDFYAGVAPKMRLFLILLSLALDLAAGLALHAVRSRLKARMPHPSPEARRLEAVLREIGETKAQLSLLRNAPAAFESAYRRNLHIGLLTAASRHGGPSSKWPATFAVVLAVGMGSLLRAQPIDLQAALDLTASSKATGYDGAAAYSENLAAAARTIGKLPPGSRVRVEGITDQSFSRPLTLLAGEIPSSPGRLHEFDQIGAARNRLSVALTRAATQVRPDFRDTDILGFLVVAGMGFHDQPGMRHVLIVFSDMRQSAAPVDLEHVETVSLREALASVEARHLLADLQGVEVFIYGAHAVGKDVRYWQSLRDFWVAYFARCHATLKVFSMMRDIPDFADAR